MRKVRILMYNNVGSYAEEAMEDGLSADAFRRDMAYLVQNDYQVVDMDEAIRLTESSQPITDKLLALTFDGGYLDAFTDVYQVLKEAGLPATFFISVRDAGGSLSLGGVDVPCLDWDQARQIAADGYEIGAYTLSGRIFYPDRPGMEEELISDIREAAQVFPDRMGSPLRYVSVREGIPGRRVHEVLKETGVEGFLTKSPTKSKPSRHCLGRIQIDDEDPNIFFVKISANYLRFKDSRTWPYLRKYKVDRLAHRISNSVNKLRGMQEKD